VAPTTGPTISARDRGAATEPHVIARAVVAPPAPPKPAIRKGVVRLSGDDRCTAARPSRGRRQGQGPRARDDRREGNVYDVIIVSADPPKHFDRVVIDALKEWKFKAEGEKYVGEVEINFSLKIEPTRLAAGPGPVRTSSSGVGGSEVASIA